MISIKAVQIAEKSDENLCEDVQGILDLVGSRKPYRHIEVFFIGGMKGPMHGHIGDRLPVRDVKVDTRISVNHSEGTLQINPDRVSFINDKGNHLQLIIDGWVDIKLYRAK